MELRLLVMLSDARYVVKTVSVRALVVRARIILVVSALQLQDQQTDTRFGAYAKSQFLNFNLIKQDNEL
jgi:hypothetical protein